MAISLFKGRKRAKRVLILGLDCAAPELIFDQFNADLPTLRGLMAGGTWGELESCIPCITVPAWASMTSSRDPGVLGCYGFRNRVDHSYAKMALADGATIRTPRVWDVLSAANKSSIVIGVPPSYPPRALNGIMLGCFLTPGSESAFAYPAIFKQEVLKITPDYLFDARDFRTEDKARLLQSIHDLTEVQYKLLTHCLQTKSWDFAMHVNIGVDRIHHGFWRYYDPQHRLHEPDSAFRHAIHDYYVMVDSLLGKVIEVAGDDVTVLVVSDHGAKRMDGGICINEWLWRNGWLTFKTPPREGEIVSFEQCEVDWARTKAWGSGGYYGRVFLNVQGREPQGVIPQADLHTVRDELAAALAVIPGIDGEPLRHQIFTPGTIYQQVNGIAPDLLVYFGDLHWRAVGSLGYTGVHTLENDTGPDDANHAQNGMFILHEPHQRGAGKVNGHQLMDIAPTMLDRLGMKIPADMQGKII